MDEPIPPVAAEATPSAPIDLNNDLDAALVRSFPSNAPKQDEQPKEVPKEIVSESQSKPEQNLAKNETKKNEKPAEVEKPLLTPEEIDKTDPKRQDAWTALKSNNKRSHKLIEQKDQEIAKLKAVVAEKGQMSQKELDELKTQNAELSKYRAMIDIQADPEFLSKFDQPIEKSVATLKDMLKNMNVSEDVINQVDFTNTKLMDQIIGHVGEHRDKFEARKLQRKVEELVDLSEKREEALAEQKDNYSKTLESKKKEAFTKQTESEGRVLKHLESIAAQKDEQQNPRFPFLNKIEPKDGATQLEIDQVNLHNKMVAGMQGKLQEALSMTEPEQKAEVAVAAVMSHYLSAQLRAANTQIKGLQDELQKVSAVNTETEKNKAPVARRNGNGQVQTVDDALASFFAR